MKFSAVVVLFITTIVSGAAASIANIDKDLVSIRKSADALKASVEAFPVNGGGTVPQANAIRRDTANFKADVDQCTKEVKATPPFSDSDSHRFLEIIKKYSPTISKFLNDIIIRRRSFENVGGVNAVPYVLEALKELGASTSAFGDAMIKSDTSDVKPQAQQLKNELAEEFHKAVDVYSK
ncbi:hydrophobic surface binding protein A-domain-containing protein [Collybia nuda]|uniref:Hydrophobic surface binding protein A-domain-containing protein n=1 Tax=Collybia nuda TaxID=64659 RepID=A0A9P5XTZ1_9AGAR|nr:hydrophobic surface binding protein A-domain-containing protein [Collybia nuda]